MFEDALLLGPTERSIVVQTRQGRGIKNSIAIEPGEPERRIYDALRKPFGDRWEERKPACGVYNCAGHVWAARRTAVYENSEWQSILSDDGYRKLDAGETSLVGDVVLCRDPQVGFLHVGMIVEMREVAPGSLKVPWVLSKWSDSSGEVLHHFRHTPPWAQQGLTVELEFWTDRPQPPHCPVGSSPGSASYFVPGNGFHTVAFNLPPPPPES